MYLVLSFTNVYTCVLYTYAMNVNIHRAAYGETD